MRFQAFGHWLHSNQFKYIICSIQNLHSHVHVIEAIIRLKIDSKREKLSEKKQLKLIVRIHNNDSIYCGMLNVDLRFGI